MKDLYLVYKINATKHTIELNFFQNMFVKESRIIGQHPEEQKRHLEL